MKKLIPLCLALAFVTGCTAGLTTVNSAASQTVTTADALYTAASIAGGQLVTLGKISRPTYQALDAKAYSLLLEVRAGKATIADLTAATTALTNGG